MRVDGLEALKMVRIILLSKCIVIVTKFDVIWCRDVAVVTDVIGVSSWSLTMPYVAKGSGCYFIGALGFNVAFVLRLMLFSSIRVTSRISPQYSHFKLAKQSLIFENSTIFSVKQNRTAFKINNQISPK